MGKLIVIEGTDGSGKSTQFKLLTERVARRAMNSSGWYSPSTRRKAPL